MTRLQNKRVVLYVALACCEVPLLSLALSETATKKSHSWGGMTLPSTLPTFTTATHPQSLLHRHVLKAEEEQQHSLQTTTRQQQNPQQQPASSSRRQFKNIEELLASFREEPVLIAFTAVNCGPCKLQKRELEKAQKRLVVDKKASSAMIAPSSATSSSVTTTSTSSSSFPRVVAIDTNKWPHVGSRFRVGKLPCLVAILNGKVLFRLEGLTKAEDVLSRLLNNNNNNNNSDDDDDNEVVDVAAASLSVNNVPQQQQ